MIELCPAPARRLSSTLAGLLAAGLLLACGAAPPPEAASLPESGAATRATDCSLLSELGCLDAAQCTLRQGEEGGYFCAPAANDCERGFVQRAGREEDCAAGCAFTPAQCYCAPDVTCVCGGGPPALCTAAS